MKRAIAVATAFLTVLIGGQSQALAASFAKPFEDDLATFTYDSGGDYCSESWALVPTVGWVMTAKGCFSKYGDVWRIQDGFADGSQTFIYWENWLKDGSTWRPYRYGECNNNLSAPAGAGAIRITTSPPAPTTMATRAAESASRHAADPPSTTCALLPPSRRHPGSATTADFQLGERN